MDSCILGCGVYAVGMGCSYLTITAIRAAPTLALTVPGAITVLALSLIGSLGLLALANKAGQHRYEFLAACFVTAAVFPTTLTGLVVAAPVLFTGGSVVWKLFQAQLLVAGYFGTGAALYSCLGAR